MKEWTATDESERYVVHHDSSYVTIFHYAGDGQGGYEEDSSFGMEEDVFAAIFGEEALRKIRA